jgi:cellulose synthase/poly-beta-1,6-N-acetylglucosamine synthase-like glycosyltransferase
MEMTERDLPDRDGASKSHDLQEYDYSRYSELAGELREPRAGEPYRVEFSRLGGGRPLRTSLLVLLALTVVGGFLVFLMLPEHWPAGSANPLLAIASVVMTVNTGLIGLFLLVNVTTIGRASLAARNPVPVAPQPGSRVAFVTTIVPDKEPIAIVRRTLASAKRIRHSGTLDVWLLDEGNDSSVRDLCARMGVHYFSRDGIERYNQPQGAFKARSKHGNYNAWLDAHGDEYEFMISVDPDHVPLENFAERFLGYFRDPDIAYVVGPQVYGNFDGFVTKSAESQQFLFHSLVQRAGNKTRTPMFVGTNLAVRIPALKAVGGLQDSVTEDIATGLAIHTTRNPETGNRWGSVYTPDVIAVGEGPTTFTDYFSQQYRWSRGTFDLLLHRFWRSAHRLSLRRFIHYLLLTSYYPTTAIAWVLGVLNSALYMIVGAKGVVVPVNLWLMFYADAAALQAGLYLWNRRHNVSPHERPGSSGVHGMFISMLSTPVFVSSLGGALLRRNNLFVVTAKGDATQQDSIGTFASHLRWAAISSAILVAAFAVGTPNPWMYVWVVLTLLVSLLPLFIWRAEVLRRRRTRSRRASQAPVGQQHSVPLTGEVGPA